MTLTSSGKSRTFAGMAGDLLGRPGDRAPLVLLPGLTFDRRIWRPVLEHLHDLDPDRQILTLDLPGHGDSPPQSPHTIEHVVELVKCAVEEAGLSRPVLVGHSMGGGIASMYAARHPAGGVVNVDAIPVIAPFVRLIQSMIDAGTGAGVAVAWAVMEQSFRTDLLPAPMRLLVADNSRPSEDLILSYWQELLRGTPEQADDGISAGMAAVAARAVPYLLICGARPAPEVDERLETLMASIATVEVWDGCGHFPHLAHPARFAHRLAATHQRHTR
jgi:pimeloyl-ACP methyl ester carboxylesterase